MIIVSFVAYVGEGEPDWNVYDAIADPIGWALIVWGMVALSRIQPVANQLWVAWVCLAISIPLWFPQVRRLTDPAFNPDIDESIGWGLSLPSIIFVYLLATTLGRTSREHGDGFQSVWFGTIAWGAIAMGALPALVYGGGLDGLTGVTATVGVIVPWMLIIMLMLTHNRPWFSGREDQGRSKAVEAS